MRILRAADHRRMPWKNGGGETLEVAAFPAGSDLGSFGWRVSIATVAAGGPFSTFAGVDRTLTILSGAGMALAVDGVGTHRLVPGGAPLSFPGDAATTARLLGGPVTDLNVMTRRGVFAHRVALLDAPRDDALFVVAAAAATLAVGDAAVSLGQFDVVAMDGPAAVRPVAGPLYAIAIVAA